MKKAMFLFAMMFAALTSHAQTNVKQDSKGNFYAIKSSTSTAAKDAPTGKTYKDTKGQIFPVYKSVKGKLYVIKSSAKTGNTYRFYLKF